MSKAKKEEICPYIIILEVDRSLLHGISPSEVVCSGRTQVSGAITYLSQQFPLLRHKWSVARTRKRSQFDTTGHVIIKVDSPSSVVAFDDGVQSLRTDAVA